MNTAVRRWRIVLIIGVFAALFGAGLVLQGEVQRARDDERFRETQAALKAGIEVFSDDAALNDDLTQDPGVSRQGSSTTLGNPDESDTQPEVEAIRSIGRLQIPKIGLDAAMLRYGRYADLEIGLGWMPQSAALGDEGAAIVVGHRTLFGAPLRRADQLKPGDPVMLLLPDGTTRDYQVRLTSIRRPTETFEDLVAGSSTSRIVIVTCHPEDSTDFRLLVVADVVEQA